MLDPADIAAGVAAAREVVADAARRAGRAPARRGDRRRGQVRRRRRPAGAPRRRHPPRRREPHRPAARPSRRRTATSSPGTSSATCRAARCATLVGRVALVHALESDSAAAQIERALDRAAGRAGGGQHRRRPVQVRRRAGRPRRVPGAPGRPRARRACAGLMTMPALAADPEDSRAAFAALRETAGRRSRPLGRHARLRRALDGHQPGLRRGGRGGRDAGAARQRASRASRPMG